MWAETKMKFSEPKWDGAMFWQSKAIVDKDCRPIIVHLKPRFFSDPDRREYDFHIGIPEELQGKGLCAEAIKSAAIQFSERFGTLILSEGRIINDRVTKAIKRLEKEDDPRIEINYDEDKGRWEIFG